MRLLIMGPPGAGKGTQSATLARHFGIPPISTGAAFRAIVERQTELGRRVEEIMLAGGLVPDDVTIQIVAERLAEPDTEPGFLLDGFPRTVPQAEALDGILDRLGTPLDAVLSLVVEPELLVRRMVKRAEIEHRADDNEETIRQRFAVYREQTAPLLSLYRGRGVLTEVDGTGDVEVVGRRIIDALAAGGG